jgi:catechol 2,3-dioxygenase-like lactoylglutathione lyase family enzyme
MLQGIDHIVIAVLDLDAAKTSYAALGFTVVEGGRHPVGTHNALIAFADGSYIELIAFYEANPSHRWWGPLQKGGGLVDFCMQTNDLPGDTAAFRRAGVAIDDPAPLSRVRPDGYQLNWVLSIPRTGHRGVAPFLIQDETPREERIPRQQTHANGVTGIGTVTVAVEDVASVRRWYAEVLGRPGREIERLELDGVGVRFEIAPHVLEFVAPKGTGAASLTAWLRRRGPSPYAATLRTTGRELGPLDEGHTHGARLALV